MASLDYIYTMEKAIAQLFLDIKCLFINRFSKFLWHLLRLLECKRMMRSHFDEIFQNEMICKKAVSKGWCKESSLGSLRILSV